MAFEQNNFICRPGQTGDFSISLKNLFVCAAGNEIALPAPQLDTNLHFTLKISAFNDKLLLAAGRLCKITVTVVNTAYCLVKSKVRKIFRTASKFASDCQRRGRRVAPLVPMALRL